MKRIWDGTGEVQPDEVYFTLRNGTLVGRPYVTARATSVLSYWARFFTKQQRQYILRATVGNDPWLAQRHGCLVSSICREAKEALFRGYV